MPIAIDDAGTLLEPEPKKKKKKPPAPTPYAGSVTPGYQPTVYRSEPPRQAMYGSEWALRPMDYSGSTDFMDRLSSAEEQTKGYLTSDIVYAVAYATTEDRESARAATSIVREILLPRREPLEAGEPIRPVIDPATGEPMSARRLRVERVMLRANIAALIADQLQDWKENGLKLPAPGRHREVVGPDRRNLPKKLTVEVDPDNVAAAVEAMWPLPGKMDAEEALAAGIDLALSGTDLSKFSANLNVIARWVGRSGKYDEPTMMALAKYWAEHSQSVITENDLVRVFNPRIAQAGEYAQAATREAEAIAALEHRERGPYTGPVDVPEEITKFQEASALAEQGAQYTPEAYAMAADAYASLTGQASQGGWLADTLMTGLEWWDRGFQALSGALWYSASIVGAPFILAANGGDPGAITRRWGEAWDMVQGEERFGHVYADHLGLERGTMFHSIVGASAEFALSFYTDPVVILGQFRRGMALTRVVSATRAETKGLGFVGMFMRRPTAAENLARIDELGESLLGSRRGLLWWVGKGVRRRWAEAAGVPKLADTLTFKQWLAYQAMKDVDMLSTLPRGVGGIGEGIDRRVGSYIHHFIVNQRNGKVTPQVIDEVWDIFRITLGMPPTTIAGRTFKNTLMQGDALDRVMRTVDNVVERIANSNVWKPQYYARTVKSKGWVKGELKSTSETKLRQILGADLKDAGLAPSEQARVMNNIVRLARDPDGWARIAAGESVEHSVSRLRGFIRDPEWEKLARRLNTSVDFAQKRVDRVLRTVFSKSRAWRGGHLAPASDAAVRREVADALMDLGVSPARTGRIVTAIVNMTKEEWDEVAKSSDVILHTVGDMSEYGLRQAAVRRGYKTWEQGLYELEGQQRVIPTIGPFQILRDMRLLTSESDYWATKAVHHVTRPFTERAPRSWLNIEDFTGDDIVRDVLRVYNFPDADISRFRSEFLLIQDLPLGIREQSFRDFVGRITEEYYRRVGLPEDMAKQLMNYIRPRYQYAGKTADSFYGWAERETATGATVLAKVETPPLSTFMLNTLMLPDSRAMDVALKRAFGTIDEVVQRAKEMFPELSKSIDELGMFAFEDLDDGAIRFASLLDDISKSRMLFHVRAGRGRDAFVNFLDHLRSAWVVMVLFRAGWPLKVLPDENLRAMVMLHNLADRLESIEGIAKVGGKLGLFAEKRIRVQAATKAVPRAIDDLPPQLMVEDLVEAVNPLYGTRSGRVWSQEARATATARGHTYDEVLEALRKGDPLEEVTLGFAPETGHFYIMDGHQTLLAAQELGVKRLPVRWVYDAKNVERRLIAKFQMPRMLEEPATLDIHFPLTGLWPDEPAAAMGLRANTSFRSVAMQQRYTAGRFRRLMEEVTAADGNPYWEGMEFIINRRIMQSPFGERILRMFANDVETGVWDLERLRSWLATSREGRVLRGKGESIDDVLDRAVGFVKYYTGGDPRIAQAALRGELNVNRLRSLMRQTGRDTSEKAPKLLLTDLEEATLFRTGIAADMRERFFRFFMRTPSDKLNRNPLYKALYDQELARRVETASALGKKFTQEEKAALEAGTHPWALRAKEKSLKTELDVMFTYMNRSRFAEASRLVFPFFSPFEEQFRVWSRLLWENPQVFGTVRAATQAAIDTGAIYQDEDGSWVIDGKVLAGGLLAATFFRPIGWLPALAASGAGYEGAKSVGGMLGIQTLENLPDVNWVYPLNALNLFFQTPLSVPIGGVDVPLPLPGFGPVSSEFVSYLTDHLPSSFPGKVRIYAWAHQTGNISTHLLPTSFVRAMTGVVGIDGVMLESAVRDMMDMAVLRGVDIGAMTPEERKEFTDGLRMQAREFLVLRAFHQFFGVTSPMPRFDSEDIREEYFGLIDEFPTLPKSVRKEFRSAYDYASETLKSRYPHRPDILLVTKASSLWNGKLPTLEGDPIPATPDALWERLWLTSDEFKSAVRAHPEFAFFLIPSEFRNLDELPTSFNAYQMQLGEELRFQRHSFEYEGTTLTGGIMYDHLVSEGWDAYYGGLTAFDAKRESLGIPNDDTDNEYKALWRRMMSGPEGVITDIEQWNQPWANEYSQTRTSDPYLDQTVTLLRQISKADLWKDLAFGKAMFEYFETRDRIYADLVANGINDIETVAARELGLTKEYKNLVADLSRRYGDDFTRAYDAWLHNDLHWNVTTQAEQVRGEVPDSALAHHAQWNHKWRILSNKAYSGWVDAGQRSSFYHRLRRMSIEAAEWSAAHSPTGDPFDPIYNAQMRWWMEKGGTTKNPHPAAKEYMLRVAMKDYVYLSPFERNVVLGIKTDHETEELWSEVESMKNDAYRTGDWDEFNKWFAGFLKQHPSFRKESRRAHTWGFGLFKVIKDQYPTWMEGQEGKMWSGLQDFTQQVHTWLQQEEKQGDWVTEDEMAEIRGIFESIVMDFRQMNHDFWKHWTLVESQSGDSPLDRLFPENWWVSI